VAGIAHEWFSAEVSLGPVRSRDKSISFKLSEERGSIGGFMSFLKSIDNLHSHSLGNYFYLPWGEKIIPLASFIPLLVASSVLSVFEAWRRGGSFGILPPAPFPALSLRLGCFPLTSISLWCSSPACSYTSLFSRGAWTGKGEGINRGTGKAHAKCDHEGSLLRE
jgi:hypothetical protein